MSRNYVREYLRLIMILSAYCSLPDVCSAQVFTIDYLTYQDNALISQKRQSYDLSSINFFVTNEFDASGASPNDLHSYFEYHVYLRYALNFQKKLQVSVAPQLGGIYSKRSAFISYGNTWFLGKFRPSETYPIAFRAGFKLGKIGRALWLKENDLDLGVLLNKHLSTLVLDASLSYRIRGKSDFGLNDLPGHFNQPGNAFHYKFQTLNQFSKRLNFSFLILGYTSGNKKLDDVLLPDSNSRKTTVGATLDFQATNRRFFKIGLLLDIAGVNDKKGFAVVLTLSE